MPQYRKLHTKIIDSYDFAEMPNDFTRVFWMLLIVALDSEGRAIDNPAWLRSRMYPLRDDVSAKEIDDAINWLEGRKMVTRYQVNGRGYFYVPNFKKYQTGTEKEAKSVLPAPQITPEEVKSESGESQEEVGVAASASESVNASESEFVSDNALDNIFDDELPDDDFDKLRRAIHDSAHISPSTEADTKSMAKMLEAGVIPGDIPLAVQWFIDNSDKPLKRVTSLEGPAITEALKRLQPKRGANGNGRKPGEGPGRWLEDAGTGEKVWFPD